MSATVTFDEQTVRYDEWFECHPAACQSEHQGFRAILPVPGFGLDIGVGGQRFAAPLGIAVGLDPAMAMLCDAPLAGVEVVAERGMGRPGQGEA
ncbi:protein of unknown function [Thauera humireducens]|uniref:hypothetical protein n=1 Tax=Thauera humireducens TaxID=1134435 RepID=UPI002467AAA0|nr:hypothetical protein [Thauera humireducens]CAH1747729.1 protein of unknown function [Thauera humireducens]